MSLRFNAFILGLLALRIMNIHARSTWGRRVCFVRGGASSDEGKDASDPSVEEESDYLTWGTKRDAETTDSLEDVVEDDVRMSENSSEEASVENPIEDSTETEPVEYDPTVEDDSSAFVDRMDFADAYDDTTDDPTPSLTTIPIATSITKEMRDSLLKLQYTRQEVNKLKPEIASMLVAKQLYRPAVGLPASYFEVQTQDRVIGRRLLKVAPIILNMLVVGAVWKRGVITDRVSSILDREWNSREPDIHQPAVEEPTPTDAEEPEAHAKVAEDPQPNDAGVAATSMNGAQEDILEQDPSQSHSMRAGQSYSHEDADVTWLDKAITFVEDQVKAIFQIEI